MCKQKDMYKMKKKNKNRVGNNKSATWCRNSGDYVVVFNFLPDALSAGCTKKGVESQIKIKRESTTYNV